MQMIQKESTEGSVAIFIAKVVIIDNGDCSPLMELSNYYLIEIEFSIRDYPYICHKYASNKW